MLRRQRWSISKPANAETIHRRRGGPTISPGQALCSRSACRQHAWRCPDRSGARGPPRQDAGRHEGLMARGQDLSASLAALRTARDSTIRSCATPGIAPMPSLPTRYTMRRRGAHAWKPRNLTGPWSTRFISQRRHRGQQQQAVPIGRFDAVRAL